MTNKSPIFPMHHSQHFSDYGFDPQINYFQVLEETKTYQKENLSAIEAFKFKLEKPISKDDLIRTTLQKKKKKRWLWKKAFIFFNWRKWPVSAVGRGGSHYVGDGDDGDMEFDDRGDVHMARARNFRAAAGSMSGPVYVTESWSGSSTPYRKMNTVPYLSLRELNMERQQRIGPSYMSGPVYLVT